MNIIVHIEIGSDGTKAVEQRIASRSLFGNEAQPHEKAARLLVGELRTVVDIASGPGEITGYGGDDAAARRARDCHYIGAQILLPWVFAARTHSPALSRRLPINRRPWSGRRLRLVEARQGRLRTVDREGLAKCSNLSPHLGFDRGIPFGIRRQRVDDT
ncbi:hypothetical protein D3C86_1580640 [compost metagenome]